MPKNLRQPARVKNEKKNHLRKLLKTTYEETEDEVEIHKFNSTICDFLTTPEKKEKNAKKHVQKTLKLAFEEAEREKEVRTR